MSEPKPVPAEVLAVNERVIRQRNDAEALVQMLRGTVDTLRIALDAVWSELPADIVLGLDETVIDVCKANHERVWHS